MAMPIGSIHVREAPKKEWQTLGALAGEWKKQVATQELLASLDHEELSVAWAHTKAQKSSSKLFNQSFHVLGSIVRELSGGTKREVVLNAEPWDSVLVCENLARRILCLALVDKAGGKIGYMATHPCNLNHPKRSLSQPCVRGAGTAVVLYMAVNALKTNQPIRLRSVETAYPFYAKLNFTKAPEEATDYDEMDGITPLKLTVEKIRRLIALGIAPYSQLKTA